MDHRLKFPVRDLLLRAVDGDYSREQLAELHKLVYLIARRCVRMRTAGGRLPLSLLGLAEADVVHDCIAELFTRSEVGGLVEISRYFNYRRIAPESLSEEHLLVHLRNLVFTVVSDNIFRMLNEADPALGKIIRNIKLAAGKSDRWSVGTRFDDRVVVLHRRGRGAGGDGGTGEGTDILPEAVEPALVAAMAVNAEIPAILRALACELGRAGTTEGTIPLVSLAVMIKTGFEKIHVPDFPAGEPESPVGIEELGRFAGECCRKVESRLRQKYVGGGKVPGEVFGIYFAALENHFSGDGSGGSSGAGALAPGTTAGSGATYYESLLALMPSLSRETYSREHRPVFEYLARLVRKCLRERIGDS